MLSDRKATSPGPAASGAHASVGRPARLRTAAATPISLSLPLVIPARTIRQGPNDDPASNLAALLRVHYRTLLAATTVGILLAYLFTGSQTPLYRASAALEIQDLNEDFLNLGGVSQVSQKDRASSGSDLPTQLRLLQSSSLLARVIEALREEKIPPPAGVLALLSRRATAEPATADARVESAATRLQVRDSRQTRIVDLTFESADPAYAADFVNQLAKQYISQSIESRLEISQGTSVWLERQMGELRANWQIPKIGCKIMRVTLAWS